MDPCLGKRKRKINASVHQTQTIGFDKKGSGLEKICHLHPRKPYRKTVAECFINSVPSS